MIFHKNLKTDCTAVLKLLYKLKGQRATWFRKSLKKQAQIRVPRRKYYLLLDVQADRKNLVKFWDP